MRKNIRRIAQIDEQSQPVLLWQYDEAVVTHEEFAECDNALVQMLQDEITRVASEQEVQNATIQANIDYLAMMTGVNLD